MLLKEATTNAHNVDEKTPPSTSLKRGALTDPNRSKVVPSRTSDSILPLLSVLVPLHALDFPLKSPEMINSLHLLRAAPIDMSNLSAYSSKMSRLTLGEQ